MGRKVEWVGFSFIERSLGVTDLLRKRSRLDTLVRALDHLMAFWCSHDVRHPFHSEVEVEAPIIPRIPDLLPCTRKHRLSLKIEIQIPWFQSPCNSSIFNTPNATIRIAIIRVAVGGGGCGVRVVREQSEPRDLFRRAVSEAISPPEVTSHLFNHSSNSPRHIKMQ